MIVKMLRRIAPAILCAIGGLAAASGALAHAIVVKSSPVANAVVAPGRIQLDVTFNTRLDRARSRLALAAPDGRVTNVPLRDDAAPTLLSGHAEVAAPGHWTLRWQVLATDGHITRGEIPFRVRSKSQR